MHVGSDILGADSAYSILGWWQDAGFDLAIDEEPRNWLGENSSPAVAASIAAPAAKPAALPATLAAYHDWLAQSENLPDGSQKNRRIMPYGNFASGMMVLVDMPEPVDAAAGTLFSDDSGQLFDRMMAAIGRDRDAVYLCSLCHERPAGGQITADFLQSLAKMAKHHIRLAAPKRVLLMGQSASRAVLGMELVAARGKLHDLNLGDAKIEAVATFSPRFLIQNPTRKADSWQDLRLFIGDMSV